MSEMKEAKVKRIGVDNHVLHFFKLKHNPDSCELCQMEKQFSSFCIEFSKDEKLMPTGQMLVYMKKSFIAGYVASMMIR